jgi:hypothetical protein
MAIRTPILGQLLARAIVPAAVALGLDSPAWRVLGIGTAAAETGGAYIAQYPTGPALSPFQIEPATAADVLRRVEMIDPVKFNALRPMRISGLDPVAQLDVNLLYAAAICRLKYWLIENPLPAANDLVGFGVYWKAWYNTGLGAGNVNDFVSRFKALVGSPADAIAGGA